MQIKSDRSKFFADESGVVSAEMVLLLAATISVSIAVSNMVGGGAQALADSTSASIASSGNDLDATSGGSEKQEEKKKKKKKKKNNSKKQSNSR